MTARPRARVAGWVRRVSVVLCTAVVVPVLPATTAGAGLLDPVATLSLTAPSTVVLGASRGYGGRLALANAGVPLQEVRLLVDGTAAATASTAVDGTYSALATLTTYGRHRLQAVAYAGTPLEVRSPVVDVEAVPGIDETTPSDIGDAATFIYTGPGAPQQGVAPATIDPARVAVLRGAVTDTAGQPLDGVVATIPGHAEYGSSTTRNGTLDMVVNGGAPVTVRYAKPGFLPVEREIPVDWQEYEVLPDVVLTPLDTAVTTVESGAAEPTVARGTAVTDADGTRRATLIFPAGTTATMTLPDGSVAPLETMNVRATEFTVGDSGEDAMPGVLPPASGYTYAVDYSVDEARAAGATQVTFDRPVATYTENFLGFRVGMAVPAGYYDYERHAWVAAPNGRVVQVVGIADGKAELDADGDGAADGAAALTALGVNDAELERVASLYAAGTSLWRVPVTHFTPWDYNWPYGLPPDAVGPDGRPLPNVPGQCNQSGSIIGCENQTLGEVLPVVGAPFTLRYDTREMPGYAAGRSVRVPLVGATVPGRLNRVDLSITVAGRRFSYSFAPSANLSYTFVWDGKDAYGRTVQGSEQATVRVSYEYEAVYYEPGTFSASFGRVGTSALTANRARREIGLAQEWQVPVGGVTSAARQSLGGWTVSTHHTYDPAARTLYLGDGTVRSASGVFDGLAAFAGTGAAGPRGDGTFGGDGGPAKSAGLGAVRGLAGGPDGSVYVADAGNGRVRHVSRSGVITTFAGGGTPAAGNGDGGPATAAELITPNDVAVAADGTVYVLDTGAGVVRRVGTDGIITTVAGGGSPADGLGDDGPATAARLVSPLGIAVAPGNVLYVADTGHDRVRRIDADGTIVTVAGGGSPADGLGDGSPGTAASLDHPTDVAVSRDGEVYVADADHNRVRLIRRDGIVTTVAGNGAPGATGDGGAATSAQVGYPTSLAVDPSDGRLYVAQRLHHRVRAIGTDGTITAAVGTGTAGSGGDNGLPARATLRDPQGVAVLADGTVYIADTGSFRVRRVVPPMPGFSSGDVVVPSSDGSEVYQFDATGRHLRTLDSITGVVRHVFGYDGSGRLTRVQDRFGNLTTIERDGAGVPTAIVSPYGARTTLTVTGGYLTRVANPANEAYAFTYRAGGLLETFTTPRSQTTTLTYDSLGRLTRDAGPDGSSTTLARTETPTGYRVTATTTEGRVTTFAVSTGSSGLTRSVTSAAGLTSTSRTGSDGVIRVTDPDGTVSTRRVGPDPRWGMQVPIPEQVTVTTPGGRVSTTGATRAVTLADAANPLSVLTHTDSLTFNGKTVTTQWNAAARTMTTTTATGRQKVNTYDAEGRLAGTRQGTLAPTALAYDTRGRLTAVTEGTGATARTTTYTYTARGLVDTVTNPLYATKYGYDLAGRVTSATLPDGKTVGFGFDAEGRRTSLTPPGRAAHGFGRTPGSMVDRYTPPAVAGTGDTTYEYDDDLATTAVRMPGGRSVEFGYDGGGRLDDVTLARGTVDYGYDASGRVSTVTAPGGEGLANTWDGYVLTGTTATGTSAATVAYTYNADLRVASRSLNGGPATTFGYDNDGRLTSSGPVTLSWHPQNGYLNGTTAGTVTTSNGYDEFGGLTSASASAGSTPVLGTTYVRDALGRVTQRTETVNGVTTVEGYRYDARGRLDRVTRNGVPVVTYTFDDNGNRLSETTATGTVTADYDAQDRLTRYGTDTFTYTPNGELASRTTAAGTTTYVYDELGNLTRVTLPSGSVVDYLVDPSGRRIGKKVDGVLVQRFVWGQGGLLLAELDGAGNTVSTFGWGSRSALPDTVTRGGATYRIVSDHLGSPRAVVNAATGAVAQRIDYDAHGRVTSDTNPGFQPFGFTGGLADGATGLLRLGQRDYDPTTGRFTAKDPAGFAGRDANLYVYVNNDPVNLVDPTGLDWLQTAGDFFAGMGDAVTFGGTRAIRQLIGVDDVVNYCSGWYTGGQITGDVLLTIVTEGAGTSVKGASYMDDVARVDPPPIKPGSSGGPTAGKPFPESVKKQALEENPNVCVYCRMETDKPQVDHVIPKSKGGNATIDNAQTTCGHCNPSKRDREFPVNPPPGYEGPWPPPHWFE